jgi:hypothetical protein
LLHAGQLQQRMRELNERSSARRFNDAGAEIASSFPALPDVKHLSTKRVTNRVSPLAVFFNPSVALKDSALAPPRPHSAVTNGVGGSGVNAPPAMCRPAHIAPHHVHLDRVTNMQLGDSRADPHSAAQNGGGSGMSLRASHTSVLSPYELAHGTRLQLTAQLRDSAQLFVAAQRQSFFDYEREQQRLSMAPDQDTGALTPAGTYAHTPVAAHTHAYTPVATLRPSTAPQQRKNPYATPMPRGQR